MTVTVIGDGAVGLSAALVVERGSAPVAQRVSARLFERTNHK